MRVSVIIPCYNAENTLELTLDSVFSQSHPVEEVIVVNDGSTDRSAEILDQWSDRIDVMHGPNRGVSHARNEGMSRATGDVIQFLDSDDLLTPDALALRLQAMNSEQADVVYSDWQRFTQSASGELIKGEATCRTIADVHADVEVACATDFWAPPAALLYTRSIVDRIGGWNTSLPVIQDARFLFDASLHGARFARCEHITALYRDDQASSLSRRNQCAFVTDVHENARQIEALWRQRDPNSALNECQSAALAGIHDYAARNLFIFGDKSRFLDAAKRSKEFSPSGGMTPFVRWAYRISRFSGMRVANILMRLLRSISGRGSTS